MAQKKTKYYSLRAYASYLGRYKYRFLLVVFFFIVANVLLAVIPIFIGKLIGSLAATPVDQSSAYRYALILIGCSVGHDQFWRAAELLYLKFINGRSYEFGNVIFQSVISKEYPYFVGKFTGKLSSYTTTLGREYKEFVETIFYNYLDMAVKLPSIALIMFSVNVYTGAIFVFSTLMMLAVGRYTIRRSMRAEKVTTDVGSDLDGYTIDVISNFVSVKAFRKVQTEADYVVERRKEVIAAANKSYFWSVVFWGSMAVFVRYVIWPSTILLNVWLFLNGRIDLAQITTFLSAVVIFSDYIWSVIWNVSQFNLKLARIEEAYVYLFGKRNIVQEYDRLQDKRRRITTRPVVFESAIELRNLTFAYPDNKQQPVLSDINLRIQKNEKVGVVGKSGSGKTTLIKLLLGYYRLSSGTVTVDGESIDNRRLIDLIDYVPQDTSLFHRTIGENIAYGATTMPSQDDIEIAARRAHAHEFITQAPGQYDSLVGERGIQLSMGQRQRIAIARAFLDNNPLLILDEATSALDSESEVLVQKALENLWADRTVLAIAHRLSTLRHMDRIIVMDDGKIVEQGTHRELLDAQGHYYRLWQHQSGGMIPEE